MNLFSWILVGAPLFVPVGPTDRPFLINVILFFRNSIQTNLFQNPTWSQLLIPPSFVGLFNRRLTTNDFPSQTFLREEPFQVNLEETSGTNPRQRSVSVITLSSDEEEEQPPRFAFSFQ